MQATWLQNLLNENRPAMGKVLAGSQPLEWLGGAVPFCLTPQCSSVLTSSIKPQGCGIYKAGLFMDSVCMSLLFSLSPSLSLLPCLPPSFSSGPGPPLQSQRTQDTSRQDLAPEPGTATGLEVFTQKSLAASPEVTVITSPPTQSPHNGLKKPLSLG